MKNLSSWKMKTINYLVYMIVRFAICFVQAIPMEMCQQGSAFLAFLFTDILRIRHKILKKNLINAYPKHTRSEYRQLCRAMWEHLFLMAVEVAKAPRSLNEINWYKNIRIIGAELLLNAVHSNRPIIMITGHFGNFEVGGYLLGLLGYPTYSVARTLDNPWLNQFIQGFRESTGQFLISKNGGYDEILDVLSNRGTMAFLADQSAGPKGCMINFFGQKASAYKAMALLSIEYNAPILICACTRRDGVPMSFNMETLDLLDPQNRPQELTTTRQITQWFTHSLEMAIRRNPEQYWWLHNRWKTY